MSREYKQSEVVIKKKFEDRYRSLLGERYDEFISCSISFLRRAIRVNTIKSDVNFVVSRLSKSWEVKQVPWCKEGFWIQGDRRDIGNLLEHQMGYIYVQEPASMIPPIVLEPKPKDIVLDMASAPGSKTTQISAMMKNKGIIVANDENPLRLKLLAMNLQRCGVENAVISNRNAMYFEKANILFDKILLDAPCSGTGTIRKSLKTLKIWNEKMTLKIAGLQKRLLDSAYASLKRGGVLVYSTCSLEPEENEENVSWFLDKYKDMFSVEINLDIKQDKPIMEFEGKKYNKGVKNCLRLYPHTNDTQGFFVCKMIKR
ncbi:MAG TPA: NOL1/NOP2/sun family putative RNA methylase [Candidatus Woesearchaeota archaeon]|nr:NOL1/NOP2/sun family putative RNA methylase [Candidatus Woesearchaeota archaeon]